MASKFSKVIFGSDDEKFWVGEQITNEGVLRIESAGEFSGCVDHRIDLALQLFLRRIKRFDRVAKSVVAHNKQVNITTRVFLAARQ